MPDVAGVDHVDPKGAVRVRDRRRTNHEQVTGIAVGRGRELPGDEIAFARIGQTGNLLPALLGLSRTRCEEPVVIARQRTTRRSVDRNLLQMTGCDLLKDPADKAGTVDIVDARIRVDRDGVDVARLFDIASTSAAWSASISARLSGAAIRVSSARSRIALRTRKRSKQSAAI